MTRATEEHLGIKRTEDGAFAFFSEGPREMTVLAFFPLDTNYFGPGQQQARHRSQAGGLRLRALRLVQRSGGQPRGTLAAPGHDNQLKRKNSWIGRGNDPCPSRSFSSAS
jgi:hypothetical protein